MDRTDYIDVVCMEAQELVSRWMNEAIRDAKGEAPSLIPYWLGQVNAYQRCLDLLEIVQKKVVNSELPKDRKETIFTCVDE